MDLFPNIFCPDCGDFLQSAKVTCRECKRSGETGLPRTGQPLWSANVPAAVQSILITDELAIVTYGNRKGPGGISAFDRKTGKERWTPMRTASTAAGGLLKEEDKIYFGTLGFLGSDAELFCLDMHGAVVWKRNLEAGVWSKPILEDSRIHVGLDNGQVQSFDSRHGNGSALCKASVTKNKGKVWLLKGDENTLIASTQSGTITLLSSTGLEPKWPTNFDLRADINSSPSHVNGILYFSAKNATGKAKGGRVISLDWRKKITRILFEVDQYDVVATPIIVQNQLWMGAMDHRLRVFDPDLNELRWQTEYKHSITKAVHSHGHLVAVCVNLYGIVLIDSQSHEELWSYQTQEGVELLSEPVITNDLVFVGTDRGDILAFPWHLGKMQKAAEHLEKHEKLGEAGLYYSLAAREIISKDERESFYEKAENCWKKSGKNEWSVRMWEGLGQPLKAAQAYCKAADYLTGTDNSQAAEYYYAASRIYWREADFNLEKEYATQAAKLGNWPRLRMLQTNQPGMTCGQPAIITFQVDNIGPSEAQKLYFTLGGSLANIINCQVETPLESDSYFNISLEITPTRTEGPLTIDVEYYGSPARGKPFKANVSIPISASPAPLPPDIINVSGVVFGGLKIERKDNRPVIMNISGVIIKGVESTEAKPVDAIPEVDKNSKSTRNGIDDTQSTAAGERPNMEQEDCTNCAEYRAQQYKYCNDCGKKLS